MTTAPRTARARAREEITRAIQQTARRHLGEVGPAALSLRAIAREVGMVSSAVYRYFPSRDELLTALIIESYDELGAALETADSSCAPQDAAGRLGAYAHALRRWAREHPHEYALLYGSPVPGYAAPPTTIPAALRVSAVILRIAEQAHRAGRHPAAARPLSEAETAGVAGVRSALADGQHVDDAHLVRWLQAWSLLFGQLSLELFGHLRGGILDDDAHWAQTIEQLQHDLGLQ
ncbi:TetR/AcrR family transcriptional regulator [Nocardioides sp.]|uniref:TetR/AcrR family transcriptional regulator n=1 Tax=Nocardioides sp. TaxID=35761 RepID=UPI0035136296